MFLKGFDLKAESGRGHVHVNNVDAGSERNETMIEVTRNPSARRAYEAAHAERRRAIANVWGWLFASTSR